MVEARYTQGRLKACFLNRRCSESSHSCPVASVVDVGWPWSSALCVVLLCRIWDTHNILQKTVVKPTTPSAARVGVTTVAYNTTGKLLAAGMADGTLQVRGIRATPALVSSAPEACMFSLDAAAVKCCDQCTHVPIFI